MRRREDRVQTMVAATLALVFLIIVPVLVLVVGVRVYHTETAVVQAKTAQLHQVDATVTETGKAPLYAPIMTMLDANGSRRCRNEWKKPVGITGRPLARSSIIAVLTAQVARSFCSS